MKSLIKLSGYGYSLRPVNINDANFIIDVRLENEERNKYIHKISKDISLQKKWLSEYLRRDDDYYFVVENNLTGEKEGLIGLYNIVDNNAEWGRWVIKKDSLASIESVDLIFKVAFSELKLNKVYSKTILDNMSVVAFHNSIGEKKECIIDNCFSIDNVIYKAVKYSIDKNLYFDNIQIKLEQKACRIFKINLNSLVGKFSFHHIGVATNNIEKEFYGYKTLGYSRESNLFIDSEQGIKGLFIVAENQPRLELLENLKDSKTLDLWLNRKNKMYHFAYLVDNINKAIEIFSKNNAKIVSPKKMSVYFKSNICFLVLNNFYIIELIETNKL